MFIEDDSKIFGSSSIWFSTHKTARKVLEKLKYSVVHLYKARSGFSILTEEYLTFQTVSPLTRLRPISRVSGKTLRAGTTPAATHIGEEVFIDRNHAGSSKTRSAQGASQAEFLREGIFRCRAGVGGQGSRAAMESP